MINNKQELHQGAYIDPTYTLQKRGEISFHRSFVVLACWLGIDAEQEEGAFYVENRYHGSNGCIL